MIGAFDKWLTDLYGYGHTFVNGDIIKAAFAAGQESVPSLMGAAGGKKSRRKITPEQQRMMQAARNLAIIKRNREGRGH